MVQHRYAVGQDVEFLPTARDTNVPRGLYTITRTLPAENGERTYRARSAKDGLERVLNEAQLRPGGLSA